jgi:hypothetical protein
MHGQESLPYRPSRTTPRMQRDGGLQVSNYLLKALVRRVNRSVLIGMVEF